LGGDDYLSINVIILYSQELPTVVPVDFLTCLQEEPVALQNFNKLPEKAQKELIDWIYSVKNDALKVERIAQALDKLNIP